MIDERGVRLGRYLLKRRLAGGGMAEIYLARFQGTAGFERDVVVKRIRPELAQSEEYVQMLLDEARIAATLHHPNLVQAFDVEEVDGEFFIAMEYLDGVDLRKVQQTLEARGEAMRWADALHIVVALAAGLDHAHQKRDASGRPLNIVHRDVSPHNVLLTREGGVKLVDFGIAKSENREGETQHGGLKGKLGYMSPEQVRGEALDHRSDLFSLGIILYELTTGRFLFSGRPEYEVVLDIAEGRVASPAEQNSEFPRALERVIARSLAARPEERYASAGEIQTDLEAFARERALSLSTRSLAHFVATISPEGGEAGSQASTDTAWVANLALKAGASELSLDEVLDSLEGDGTAVEAESPSGDSGATAVDVPAATPRPRGSRDAANASPARGVEEESSGGARGSLSAGRSEERARGSEGGAIGGQAREASQNGGAEPLPLGGEGWSPAEGPVDRAEGQSEGRAPELKSGRRGLWLATVALVVASGAVTYGLWEEGRFKTAEEAENARATQMEPPAGSLRVRGDPEGAGVWLHLGEAPAKSPPLPADRPHQLRVEREGYASRDIAVPPSRWAERDGDVGVWIDTELEGEAEGEPALGVPESPEEDAFRPAVRGQGEIRVDASPDEADVWLFVGLLPDARVDGVRADRDHLLRVAKPDFEPVELRAEPGGFEPPLRREEPSGGGAEGREAVAEFEVALEPAE